MATVWLISFKMIQVLFLALFVYSFAAQAVPLKGERIVSQPVQGLSSKSPSLSLESSIIQKDFQANASKKTFDVDDVDVIQDSNDSRTLISYKQPTLLDNLDLSGPSPGAASQVGSAWDAYIPLSKQAFPKPVISPSSKALASGNASLARELFQATHPADEYEFHIENIEMYQAGDHNKQFINLGKGNGPSRILGVNVQVEGQNDAVIEGASGA